MGLANAPGGSSSSGDSGGEGGDYLQPNGGTGAGPFPGAGGTAGTTGTGGNGQLGGFPGSPHDGGGGGGGYGQTLTGTGAGGTGGNGGAGTFTYIAGSGGGGGLGTGVISQATLTGNSQGGNGGVGGNSTINTYSGGSGGFGGDGSALYNAGTSLTIELAVFSLGGNGGNAGGGSSSGNGGNGGSGVLSNAAGQFINNNGIVTGGNGGVGGGLGGAGIIGFDLTVTNTGTITGGFNSGSTTAQADAITFISGTNVLNYGGTINGNLAIQAGTLKINAAAGGSTVANVITGAGGLNQNSANTLDLTGDSTYTGGTALTAGTLVLSQQTSAGTGAITFGAGATETLELDSSGTLGAPVAGFAVGDKIDLSTLNSSGATASYNGTTLTVNSGLDIETIAINAAPSGYQYSLAADGMGGTDVVLTAVSSGGGGDLCLDHSHARSRQPHGFIRQRHDCGSGGRRHDQRRGRQRHPAGQPRQRHHHGRRWAEHHLRRYGQRLGLGRQRREPSLWR